MQTQIRIGREIKQVVLPIANQVESLKRDYPNLSGAFSRLYKGADPYHDYRRPLIEAVATMGRSLSVTKEDAQKLPMIEQITTLMYMEMEQRDYPTYFLSSNMLDALKNTDTPDEVDLESLNVPFENFVVILPKGGIKSGDKEACYLRFGSIRPKGQRRMVQFVVEFDNETQFAHHGTGKITPKNAYQMTQEMKSQIGVPLGDLKREDEKILVQCVSLILNIIYLMNARPELVEHGTKQGTHKKSRQEIWSPRVIGRTFRVQGQRSTGETQEGYRVRVHWRRGHYRQQRFGAGRTERKIIWIEPALIGAKDEK